MSISKHSFAFSTALAVTLVYAAYGLLLHYMPHYASYHGQLLHVKDVLLVAIPTLHGIAVASLHVFIISFVVSFVGAFVYNLCTGSCCSCKD